MRVTSLGPSPQRWENGVIHRLEHFRAHRMPVIHRPAPDDRGHLADETPGCRALVRLNDTSDFPQRRFDTLRRRLDEQLAGVLAEVLAETVKSICHVRDVRLLRRDAEATLLQE